MLVTAGAEVGGGVTLSLPCQGRGRQIDIDADARSWRCGFGRSRPASASVGLATRRQGHGAAGSGVLGSPRQVSGSVSALAATQSVSVGPRYWVSASVRRCESDAQERETNDVSGSDNPECRPPLGPRYSSSFSA